MVGLSRVNIKSVHWLFIRPRFVIGINALFDYLSVKIERRISGLMAFSDRREKCFRKVVFFYKESPIDSEIH